ncbi:MAG: hypothetical protein WB985_01690 [Candidatus Acidiferrales bacterium]
MSRLNAQTGKWQDGGMSAVVMLVILIIAIVPVAMVLRSKRRRLGTRASRDAAEADPQSTLRLGADANERLLGSQARAARAVASGEKWAPSAASEAKRVETRGMATGRERKPGSKDATAASDPKSTLKLN